MRRPRRAFCRRARDAADADDELRFRAAFNTALSQAQRAASLTKEQPQEAVNVPSQSAAWFRDAVRLRPNDADARHNLELVLRRLQTLRDQLNKGRTRWKRAWLASLPTSGRCAIASAACFARIAKAGASDEPLAFHGEFKTRRRFSARCCRRPGQCWIWPAMSAIACRSEPKKIASQKSARLIQLQNLEHYLNLSRGTLPTSLGCCVGCRASERIVRLTSGSRSSSGRRNSCRIRSPCSGPGRRSAGHARPDAGAERVTGPESALDCRRRCAPTEHTGVADAEPPCRGAARDQAADRRASGPLAGWRRACGAESLAPADPSQPPAAGSDPRQAAARERMLQAAREAIPLLNEAMTAMDQVQTALASEQLEMP